MSADQESAPDIREIAARHGFGESAGRAMAAAIVAGHGTMAQFSHSDLGGMGQWSQGGMLMIGDMFNDELKARVGALAADLARAVKSGELGEGTTDHERATTSFAHPKRWWPEELGSPSSSGGQNGNLYAIFPSQRRLALKQDGRLTIRDTGDHRIVGVSQQQSSHSSLTFTTSSGTISLDDLKEVDGKGV